MDFITNLPFSHGYSTILVVMDKLSKFAHFIALKATFNSKMWQMLLLLILLKYMGFLRQLTLIEIVFSSVHFGSNCSKHKAQLWS